MNKMNEKNNKNGDKPFILMKYCVITRQLFT